MKKAITTRPVRAPITSNFAADDGAGDGGNGEPFGVGPETDGGGDTAFECFGDGEGDVVFDGGEETGWPAGEGFGGGEGTAGVVDGGGEGTAGVVEGGGAEAAGGGGVEAARVVTLIFMPPRQCPAVPQMKYLVPAEVRGMTVAPPVCGGCRELVAVQES